MIPCGREDSRHIGIIDITRPNDFFFELNPIKVGRFPINNDGFDALSRLSLPTFPAVGFVGKEHVINKNVDDSWLFYNQLDLWIMRKLKRQGDQCGYPNVKETNTLVNSIPELYYCLGPVHQNACGCHCCRRSLVHLGANHHWGH